MLDAQYRRIPWGRQLRKQTVDRAPHHLRHQDADIGRSAVVTSDQVTIAHDHDLVGDPRDLIHAMTDVDEGHTLLLQFLDLFEQQVGFVLAQGCGRLVENQQTRVERQGPGDFHQLLGGDFQLPHRCIRRDIQTQAPQLRLCFTEHLLTVDDAVAGRQMTEENVLRHAQVRQQVDFLMDHVDPQRHRSPRSTRRVGFTGQEHRAFGRRQCAGDDGGKGRFTRAVFPQQCHHFSIADIEADIFQHPDRIE
ncbi:hypothetical protein D3C76_919530 [compost metagenome]